MGRRADPYNKLEKRFDHTSGSAKATAYFCDAADMKSAILSLRSIVQVAGVCRDISTATFDREALAHNFLDKEGSDTVCLDGAFSLVRISDHMVSEFTRELLGAELI